MDSWLRSCLFEAFPLPHSNSHFNIDLRLQGIISLLHLPRNTGFILEGFPRTSDDCQYLVDRGFFPDLALLLMVEDEDVVKRLLPPRMALWKERREIQNEKKRRIAEEKMKLRVRLEKDNVLSLKCSLEIPILSLVKVRPCSVLQGFH